MMKHWGRKKLWTGIHKIELKIKKNKDIERSIKTEAKQL